MPTSDGDREVWNYAANYSDLTWRVFIEATIVKARLEDAKSKKTIKDMRFAIATEPLSESFKTDTAVVEVDDGWLVGYNCGEFGAALYWFSKDRKKYYKISDHHIVDFIKKNDGLYAIEGLSHMGSTDGSWLRLAKIAERWQAKVEVQLPCVPFAASLKRDQDVLVVCTEALLSIGRSKKTSNGNMINVKHKLLLQDGLWPTSSAMSDKEDYLYIGARQYVIQVDLRNMQVRYLIPDSSFLNKLPQKKEKQIRQQWSGK
ncbi:hypothetical protein ACO0LF_27835 [Undibacterium sp. Di27W]|uniref:hypothetical protein n=1 Tax=Undibacterium sp. Di27W TaxID=3413036 RepID=UPI003BF45AAC